MDAAKPDWCSLPHFLLQLISGRLHTRIDILRFRAVCGDFRASTPLPPEIIPLKIPVPVELNPNDGDHLLLTESTVYAIQPLNGTETWLVKAEETSSGKLLVFDLFCRFHVKHYLSNKLPSKSLNLLDYRVNEISKRHVFQLVSVDKDKAMKYSAIVVNFKFVASKCLDKIDDDEFAVMAIYTDKVITVWRNGDNNWTNIEFSELYSNSVCQDIVYQSGKFYVVCNTGLVVNIDSKSLIVTEVVAPTTDCNIIYNMVFMKSSEDLFLIDYQLSIDHHGSPEYYVSDTSCILKIDKEKRKLVKVNKNALKDRVFFVGDDCSFSISAKEYSECKKNCLYLTLDEMYSALKFQFQSNDEQLCSEQKFLRDAIQIYIVQRFERSHRTSFYAILRFSEAPIQFPPRLPG
ncbi:hypothetical protein LWI29_023786 [Acer saccharum]|uniref:KIB1-4 beta-propeller domain-containing protein n=1 Tax=Acer saccharum TaxID=4024 RepID=A0AA39RSW9_ACESA|nr:hypothetical protein LWI29_023786 [Acer saccharum]